MDTNYYKKYEPIFGSWHINRLIGEGSFGQVFEIERNELGTTYKAALKTITIPQSQSELNSVKADGLSDDDVTAYYEGVVHDIISEFVLMSQMKGTSNIVSYEDHQIIKHEDGIGWDILIRMELLTPLFDHLKDNACAPEDVAQMGIDLCKALELCQKRNIVHRDVKPENVFISSNGDYKLGDFGIARTVEKTMSGLSRKGTFLYMAPEVYLGKAYGATVDIYSLGLVMYRLLNDNRMPFFPEYPKPITHTDRENSLVERISGAALPKPTKAPEKLAEIILKACEFEPEKRYHTASEMRVALENCLKDLVSDDDVKVDEVMFDDEFAKALEEEQENGTVMIEEEEMPNDNDFVEEAEESVEKIKIVEIPEVVESESEDEETTDVEDDDSTTVNSLNYVETIDADEDIISFDENNVCDDAVLPILEKEPTETDEIVEEKSTSSKNKKTMAVVIAAILVIIIGIVIVLVPSSDSVKDVKGLDDGTKIVVGETFAPEYVIEPDKFSDEEIKFEVSDEDIISVDEDGVIMANEAGEVVLTIIIGDYREEVTIIVVEEEEENNESSDDSHYSPTYSKDNGDKDKYYEEETAPTVTETEATESTAPQVDVTDPVEETVPTAAPETITE